MAPKVSVVIPVYNVDKYIRKMLTSVKEQTFTDFEVIIVNDGSTDDSQMVIEEFCRTDQRFKCFSQKNQGVATARNKGIFEARGEYIVFYDPDDFIPRKALHALYKSVDKNDADMAIGVMKEVSAGESRCNSHTIKLGKKELISRYNKELLWSFSVCNKIFKLDMIKTNNIVFPALKHAEDAVFLFKCIFASRKICGCKTVVYEYQFRSFWEGQSATQMITSSYLTDVIAALDMLERMIIDQVSVAEESEKTAASDFLNEFYIRYVHISLLNGYYRQLWNADDDVLGILNKKITILQNNLSKEHWNKIISDNRDIQIEKALYEKESVSEEAVLTFIVPNGLDNDSLTLMLNSIFNQGMPSFRVHLNQKYREMLSDKQIKMNMVFSDSCSLNDVETEFVVFLEEGIVFSKNSIRAMTNILLKNDQLDYVTAPLKQHSNGYYYDMYQAAAFTVLQCINNKMSKYDTLDKMLGNKVFRRSRLVKPCESMKYRKINNVYMISFGNEDKGSQEEHSSISRVSIKIKLKQKAIEDRIIRYIKERYTKDDIKKILKREI